jgi:cytochrome P450
MPQAVPHGKRLDSAGAPTHNRKQAQCYNDRAASGRQCKQAGRPRSGRRSAAMASDDRAGLAAAVETPKGRGFAGAIIGGRGLPDLAARVGARIAAFEQKPLKFGKVIIAARHADAQAVLARDLDFLIAPNNAARIEAVNGPFVLGMDRGPVLERERRALYSALAAVDQDALKAAAQIDIAALIGDKTSVDAVGGFARIVAGKTAARLFGLTPEDEPLFRDVARAIFNHTFLNLGGDKAIEARALRAAAAMKDWFTQQIARRRTNGDLGDDMMGALLSQKIVDDDCVRRTLGGMLVGSIDTTASAVAKILSVIQSDATLRAQFARTTPEVQRYALCMEALRRWPHNPIVLRTAAAAGTLNGTTYAAGDRIVVWTQAAMQDRAAFPEPRRMRADRDPRSYLHFGGALHSCAGRVVNGWQIPLLVGALVERKFRIEGKMGWAGPFPDTLPVKIDGVSA